MRGGERGRRRRVREAGEDLEESEGERRGKNNVKEVAYQWYLHRQSSQ